MKREKARVAFEELVAENESQAQLIELLHEQVRTDRLTGIYNMVAMEEHIAASRYEGYYVFADLDEMGKRNKSCGHDRVNKYIAEFGQWLRATTRGIRGNTPCDAIAIRKHGDEFLVWCSSKRGSIAIRNRIRQWTSKDKTVTCSAGIGRDVKTADLNCSRFKKTRKQNVLPQRKTKSKRRNN